MRVLDQIAEAFHRLRGRPKPRRVVGSLALKRQFPGPVRRSLRCPPQSLQGGVSAAMNRIRPPEPALTPTNRTG